MKRVKTKQTHAEKKKTLKIEKKSSFFFKFIIFTFYVHVELSYHLVVAKIPWIACAGHVHSVHSVHECILIVKYATHAPIAKSNNTFCNFIFVIPNSTSYWCSMQFYAIVDEPTQFELHTFYIVYGHIQSTLQFGVHFILNFQLFEKVQIVSCEFKSYKFCVAEGLLAAFQFLLLYILMKFCINFRCAFVLIHLPFVAMQPNS